MSAAPREVVQERAQVTRGKLLSAAVSLFAERGYDATATREIEAEAGVNRGLISYHFGSKEALWKAAMESLFAGHSENLTLARGESEELDPVARFEHVIRAFVRYSAERPEVNRIMVQEGKRDDWRLEWIVERYVEPYYALTKALYDEVVAVGAARPMEHLHFHYILTGGAALIFAMAPECRRLSGLDPHAADVVDAHADALIQLLLPGAADETRNVHARSQDTNRARGRRGDRRSGGGRTGAADGHEAVPRRRRGGVVARPKR